MDSFCLLCLILISEQLSVLIFKNMYPYCQYTREPEDFIRNNMLALIY